MTQIHKLQGNNLSKKTQSRLGSLMGARIVGTGSYVPDRVVTNADLDVLGYDSDWIVQRTGIHQRCHATDGIATSDMAIEASRRCIEGAGVDPANIDLVLLGTFTADLPLPASACLVQDKLGLRAPALDISAACSSFIFSMLTGMQFIASGCNRLVLVIGADCNSRIVDPADKKTYPLFGDGAGAVLLAPGSLKQGLLSYAVGADGSGAELLYRRMGGSRMPFTQEGAEQGFYFMRMEGRPIFKWAVRIVADTVNEVLQEAGKSIDDVDLFVFHQANQRIISSVAGSLGLDEAKVANNLDKYGNTSAASIPLVLDEVYRQGRIKPGDLLLLSGFGAGLTWGTALLQW